MDRKSIKYAKEALSGCAALAAPRDTEEAESEAKATHPKAALGCTALAVPRVMLIKQSLLNIKRKSW